ncbi:MAG: 23S rRNA (cytidine1920-2'-O)/16S rRNA (cytidine1409-2'-O)-methyltransferase [Alteromonas naphthalenivorans]|jgi:23S rRNA (cytidine1920-2'-O)/16S rRNA (cytidine1409-2'-O)-methyltransferase
MIQKERLDKRIQELYPHLTRNQVQGFIMQGKVKVNDKVITKSGVSVSTEDKITLDETTPKFVCRAGFKLEAALDDFAIDVTGMVIVDAGLSTGGFTDCLLQRGAKKVYGVDVGYGQVHEKIRTDKRVEIMERTNFRYLKTVGERADLITLDLSFISLLKVMDTVEELLKPDGKFVVLIKPQFEAHRDQVGKKGIIKDESVHKEVIDRVTNGIIDRGFVLKGLTDSPIKGATGNKEFLAYFQRT